MKIRYQVICLILAVLLYGLSRPSLFIIDGLARPWNYLSPILELISLTLFVFTILSCRNWKDRLLASFIYTFSCQSLLYYAGILFTIQRLLPAEPFTQHLINIFLIGYNHFHIILWGAFLVPWAQKSIPRWILISLMMVVWEYHIPTIIIIPVGQTWIDYAPHLGLASIFGFPIYGMFQYVMSGLYFKRKGALFVTTSFLFFIILNLNFSEKIISSNKVALTHMSLEPRGVLARDHGHKKMQEMYFSELQKGSPTDWDFDFWLIPESAWPLLITNEDDINDVLYYFFPNGRPEKDFAVGVTRLIERSNYLHVKNSFVFFDKKGGHSFYDKVKLMPFSETNFMGLSDEFVADILGKKDFNIAGTDYPLYQIDQGPSFVSTICSEVSHLGFVQRYMSEVERKPDFIINGANDKWFTPSNIPLLHFIMNRWMAVSFDVPVVRATIGGISGFISYDGQVTSMTASTETKILTDRLIYRSKKADKSIYARYGLIPLFILSSLTAILFFVIEKRKGNER